MIKFIVKVIIVGQEEVQLNYNVNAESPEEALPIALNRQRFEDHHSVSVGDCVIVSNPATGLNLYYILDKPDLLPKKVSEPEFIFWRDWIASNPSLKSLGIDAAVENTIDLLKDMDQKGVCRNGSG